jgi:hypothetical protein
VPVIGEGHHLGGLHQRVGHPPNHGVEVAAGGGEDELRLGPHPVAHGEAYVGR